ncbi:MAG: methyltransferase family protein [Planctomycetota bacterium]|jgi:protein-S-isoprenylcysteine O-methyltransferase Ste14
MRNAAALPIYAYFALILISRLFFRHRECVRASGREGGARSGGGRAPGLLFCLLPLAMMQLAPFFEYWVRLWPMRGTDAAKDFFALLTPGGFASGIMLFAAGVALAARASRQLARGWAQAPGQLFTGGIYSVVRHPLYAGYLVQGAGCMLILGARLVWVLYAVAAALVLVKVYLEDRELGRCFPEFPEYARRTKRLVPGVF